MEPRRWLPYQRLATHHLGLALATSRVIAWLGMLLIAAGIAFGLTAVVTHHDGNSLVLTLGTVLGWVGYGLVALVVSGGLAGLVAIEENLRRQQDGK